MSQVTLEALAERVQKLEQEMTRLLQKQGNHGQTAQQPPPKEPEPIVFKDWRKAVEHMATMPPGDEEFRQAWVDAMREAHEADRRAAIEEADRDDAEREGRP
jgi:hypothetical protein